ncbi:MAG: aminopeptidase [Lachnospiraceae bacterium]|nr:aminopeptidase [Lachnospiraceae bacterium]
MKTPELFEWGEFEAERTELALGRLTEILSLPSDETEVSFVDFGKEAAAQALCMAKLAADIAKKGIDGLTEEELRAYNKKLYLCADQDVYETSFLNPAHAVSVFGKAKGRIVSAVFADLIARVSDVYAGVMRPFLYSMELVLEVYSLLENGADANALKRALFYHRHDYSEEKSIANAYMTYTPGFRHFSDITMKADLTNPRYLYTIGCPVTENMIQVSSFLATLPEKDIESMAETFVNGYVEGFAVTGTDFSKKKYVQVVTGYGFERITRAAIRKIEELGKEAIVLYYEDVYGGNWLGENRQAVYDHRNDSLLTLNKRMVETIARSVKKAFENVAECMKVVGGPAVQETFGEPDFDPVNKPEVLSADAKMSKLKVEMNSRLFMLREQYMPGEERSFTIISYPVPSIGPKFKDIFKATIRVNTLSSARYKKIHQCIIDVLDQAAYVTVKGSGENKTDMRVMLHELTDPAKQTNFENCAADVNIPVGEVFTSPVLKGTDGVLHVSKVYLEGRLFKDLCLTFKDGMIASITCANFPTEKENADYINENIMDFHETLPIGEFAIGTNTTAYEMGIKYDIQSKLQILIAEKTGPHFAVGDTCYSHAEDKAVFNPDGKEIIARENEVSALRKTDPAKAYMNCHTDITIPYDELESITAHTADGKCHDIIRNGLFVVPGTEELNVPLERLAKAKKK